MVVFCYSVLIPPDPSVVVRSLELIALVRMEPILLCIGGLSEIEVVLALANVRMTRDFPHAGEFIEDDLHRAAGCAKRTGLVSDFSVTGSPLLRLLDIPISFSTDPALGRVVDVGAFDFMHGSGAAALALLHLMQTGSSGTCFLRSRLSQGNLKMVRSITSDAFVSIDLGTVSYRDAVRLVYGWHVAKGKGIEDLSLVYPQEPAWSSAFRMMSQFGAIDELPIDVLVTSVQKETGLEFKLDGRQLLIKGLASENVPTIAELLHHHVNRNAIDGMKAIVGFGAVVNAGSSVPLVGWLLDLELVELLGAEALIGPCCWLWGLSLPLLVIQVALLTRRVLHAPS